MKINDYEKEHLARLYGSLAECTVLLRNGGDFPLEKPCPLAAFGSGARRTVKGGTGSGEVNSRAFVTVEEGLQKAGFTVTTGAWLDAYDALADEAKKAFLARLKAEARAHHQNAIIYGMGKAMPAPEYELPLQAAGNVAIYVLSRISVEGNDRDPVPGDILLTESDGRAGGSVRTGRGAEHPAPVAAGRADRGRAGRHPAGAAEPLRQTDHHVGGLGGIPGPDRFRRP